MSNQKNKLECYTLQCVDGSDCSQKEACVNNKCVDACAASNACGSNSDCTAVNHRKCLGFLKIIIEIVKSFDIIFNDLKNRSCLRM